MGAYAISAANLDIVEKSLQNLSGDIHNINGYINSFSNHLYQVDESIKAINDGYDFLEKEIKSFMLELRESSVVSNARQTILMNQAEVDKKFKNYEDIRAKISGVLKSLDLSFVKKSTFKDIADETVVNGSNYWLAPALVALCAWYLDDKALADKALNEAMKRDDEKTSLLFCLICLKVDRVDASIKWLDRYLSMQNPNEMESQIITVVDAITNGSFGNFATNLFLEKLSLWNEELSIVPEVKEELVKRWKDYFDNFKEDISSNCFPYLMQYGDNYDSIKNISSISLAKDKIYSRLNEILESKNTYNSDINAIINSLIYNYENEELELKKDIIKNKLIIEENGNVSEALKKFEENKYSLTKFNNFYNHLTSVSLGNYNIYCSINSRKFSMAYLKDFMKEGYNQFKQVDNLEKLPEIKITIDDWVGSTRIGDNGKQLNNDLYNFFMNKYHSEIYSEKYFNIKILISLIVGILSMFFLHKFPIVLLIILLCLFGFISFEVYKTYKNRTSKKEYVIGIIKQKKDILDNTLAEVVDYYFVYKDSLATDDKIDLLINNLNYNSYISKGGK